MMALLMLGSIYGEPSPPSGPVGPFEMAIR
jgi:hypothetical protein